MLNRSLGAGSFSEFWQFWNPIWGYYLGRLFFVPLKKWLPPGLALIVTFVISGALHDIAITAIRLNWTLLFTPWFFLMGLSVVFSNRLKINYKNASQPIRAMINTGYVGVCLVITILAKGYFT